MKREDILIVIFVLVILGGGVWVYKFFLRDKLAESPLPTPIQKAIVDPSRGYAPGLPAGLPIDKPLDIVDNSTATIGDRYAAIVEYISGESLTKNLSSYRNWLGKNGWRTMLDFGDKTSHFLKAQKLASELSYTFSVNSISGKHYVKLVYTQPELSDLQKEILDNWRPPEE